MFNLDYNFDQIQAPADHLVDCCELNRLLSAAIVSNNFRTMLFANPEIALAKGYQGEKFNLTRDEYSWLISVRATDLASFAAQLLDFQNALTPKREVAFALKIPAMSYLDTQEIYENG
jgi:hypothetical protein